MIRISEPTPFGTVFLESSAVCFHWDTTHPVASLAGRGVRILKQVALFQKGQSGSSLDHFVTLPARQQFKCDSPESTVLQDRLRINCATDARVLFEIELSATFYVHISHGDVSFGCNKGLLTKLPWQTSA